MKPIRQLKRGEFFTLKPTDNPAESQVYVRGDYIRGENRYECGKFSDISYTRMFAGSKMVYTEFTF